MIHEEKYEEKYEEEGTDELLFRVLTNEFFVPIVLFVCFTFISIVFILP